MVPSHIYTVADMQIANTIPAEESCVFLSLTLKQLSKQSQRETSHACSSHLSYGLSRDERARDTLYIMGAEQRKPSKKYLLSLF